MLRIATRSSALALTQARQVAELLGGGELVECSSDGEPGDKGRFVRGVELALVEGRADVGVHSAKDVPSGMLGGLAIAAVPAREDPRDVWVGPGSSLDDVPEGVRVGTASLRRRAQLLAARPDLRVEELHGNVDTRLRKLAEGEVDALVLAAAGLRRLGRDDAIAFPIPIELMTPAAGQGALALQAGAENEAAWHAARGVGDETSMRELTAERAAVAMLEATCASPIGIHARVRNGQDDAGQGTDDATLVVEAFVGLPDGSEWVRDRVEADAANPAEAGELLAERLTTAGAREILERAETME